MVFNGEVLFDGLDASGSQSLWETNGTAAGTFEIGGLANSGVSGAEQASGGILGGLFPLGLTVFNGEVLFEGNDASGDATLWVTDGTAAGTTEIGGLANSGVSGAFPTGLYPSYLTVFNGEVLFAGEDASLGSFKRGLWVTNGTAAGTREIGGLGSTGISGASSGGLYPSYLTVLNGEVLFGGYDASGDRSLWETNGTAVGTTEIGGLANSGVSGANSLGLQPANLTVSNGEVLFEGTDAGGNLGLWETNGTAAGTFEIGGLANSGVSGANLAGLNPSGFTPMPELFTTGDNTVDFAGTLSGVLGLTPAQVQAINAGAQLYNALGGTDTVTLPSSLDGTTYPLVPQSGAPAINPGIMWDPSQTFVVGSAADGPSNIDTIYAGTPGVPTLGSYQIHVNGAATATITLYDNSNAINNTITLGTGNDTVTLDGNGNSTVVGEGGNSNLYISGGAYAIVSSTFSGSANIGANSTLEIQGSPIAIAALSGSANIEGAAPGTGSGSTIAFYRTQRHAQDRRHYDAGRNDHGFRTGGHDHFHWVVLFDCLHRPQSQQRARGLYDGRRGIRPEARSDPSDALGRLCDHRLRHFRPEHHAIVKLWPAPYCARFGLYRCAEHLSLQLYLLHPRPYW
jgi:hypothetical protein